MSRVPRSRRALAAGMATALYVQMLLSAVLSGSAEARVNPLNTILRQVHKANMLIVLDTSGSMNFVPGGASTAGSLGNEVGVDCDNGKNCRGGGPVGFCNAQPSKTCQSDFECRIGTCLIGGDACQQNSDCPGNRKSCAVTNTLCNSDTDCAIQTGQCSDSGDACTWPPVSSGRAGTIDCAPDGRCSFDNAVCYNPGGSCTLPTGTCSANGAPCSGTMPCAGVGTCAYPAFPVTSCTNPGGSCTLPVGTCSLTGAACSGTMPCATGLGTCSSVGGVCTNPGGACTVTGTCSASATSCTSNRTCEYGTSPAGGCTTSDQCVLAATGSCARNPATMCANDAACPRTCTSGTEATDCPIGVCAYDQKKGCSSWSECPMWLCATLPNGSGGNVANPNSNQCTSDAQCLAANGAYPYCAQFTATQCLGYNAGGTYVGNSCVAGACSDAATSACVKGPNKCRATSECPSVGTCSVGGAQCGNPGGKCINPGTCSGDSSRCANTVACGAIGHCQTGGAVCTNPGGQCALLSGTCSGDGLPCSSTMQTCGPWGTCALGGGCTTPGVDCPLPAGTCSLTGGSCSSAAGTRCSIGGAACAAHDACAAQSAGGTCTASGLACGKNTDCAAKTCVVNADCPHNVCKYDATKACTRDEDCAGSYCDYTGIVADAEPRAPCLTDAQCVSLFPLKTGQKCNYYGKVHCVGLQPDGVTFANTCSAGLCTDTTSNQCHIPGPNACVNGDCPAAGTCQAGGGCLKPGGACTYTTAACSSYGTCTSTDITCPAVGKCAYDSSWCFNPSGSCALPNGTCSVSGAVCNAVTPCAGGLGTCELGGSCGNPGTTTTFTENFDAALAPASWINYNAAYETVPFVLGGTNVLRNVSPTGAGNYTANFQRPATLGHGKMFQVDVQFPALSTNAHFAVEATAGSGAYRRFAILQSGSDLVLQLIDGAAVNWTTGGAYTTILPSISVNTWYTLQIFLDDQSGFKAVAFPTASPGSAVTVGYPMGALQTGSGLAWNFHHWLYGDASPRTAYMDNYSEKSIGYCTAVAGTCSASGTCSSVAACPLLGACQLGGACTNINAACPTGVCSLSGGACSGTSPCPGAGNCAVGGAVCSDDPVPTLLDTFDSLNATNWPSLSIYQTIVSLAGNNAISSGPTTPYNSNFYGPATLTTGKEIKVRFQAGGPNPGALLAIETADGLRRFGIYLVNSAIRVQYNKNDGLGWIYPVDLMAFAANNWYTLRITIDDSANGFQMEVKNEVSLAKASYSVVMPAGQSWRFHHWNANLNTTYLDDYRVATTQRCAQSGTCSATALTCRNGDTCGVYKTCNNGGTPAVCTTADWTAAGSCTNPVGGTCSAGGTPAGGCGVSVPCPAVANTCSWDAASCVTAASPSSECNRCVQPGGVCSTGVDGGLVGIDQAGGVVYATATADHISHATWGGAGGYDSVFQWMPNTSGTATFSTLGSTFDTILWVRMGGCTNYTQGGSNTNTAGDGKNEVLSLAVTAGQRYHIGVDSAVSGVGGNIKLTVTAPAGSTGTPSPMACASGSCSRCSNDPNTVCTSATSSCKASGDCGNNGGSCRADADCGRCADDTTVACAGSCAISGLDCANGVSVACGDDIVCTTTGTCSFGSQFEAPITSGQKYYIQVDGKDMSAMGGYLLRVGGNTITSQTGGAGTCGSPYTYVTSDTAPDVLINTTLPPGPGGGVTTCSIAGTSAGAEMVFAFTPHLTGNWLISTYGSSIPTTYQVYTGLGCGGTSMGCVDMPIGNYPSAELALTAGTTYTILVDTTSAAGGTFKLRMMPPMGTNYTGALGSTCSVPTNLSASTAFAVAGGTFPGTSAAPAGNLASACGGSGAGENVFKFTTGTGTYTFDAYSTYDTSLYFYTGSCGGSSPAACDDDGLAPSGGGGSRIVRTFSSSTIVWPVVDGFNQSTNGGTYTLMIQSGNGTCKKPFIMYNQAATPVLFNGTTGTSLRGTLSTGLVDMQAPILAAPCPTTNNNGADQLYTFTAGVTGTIYVTTQAGSTIDTIVSMRKAGSSYTGSLCLGANPGTCRNPVVCGSGDTSVITPTATTCTTTNSCSGAANTCSQTLVSTCNAAANTCGAAANACVAGTNTCGGNNCVVTGGTNTCSVGSNKCIAATNTCSAPATNPCNAWANTCPIASTNKCVVSTVNTCSAPTSNACTAAPNVCSVGPNGCVAGPNTCSAAASNCSAPVTNTCSAAASTCVAAANNCSVPYTNPCTGVSNTCSVPSFNNCVSRTNTCDAPTNNCRFTATNLCQLPASANDTCSTSGSGTSSSLRMCRKAQTMCTSDSDCTAQAGDTCGPATSRTVIAKRVLNKIIQGNYDLINFGLMTFYQSGYFPYYTGNTSAGTTLHAQFFEQDELSRAGCFTLSNGPTATCVKNGITYTRASPNSQYRVHSGGHNYTYWDRDWNNATCNVQCPITGQGTGYYQGSYYTYTTTTITSSGTLVPQAAYTGKVIPLPPSTPAYVYYTPQPNFYNYDYSCDTASPPNCTYIPPAPPPIDPADCWYSCSPSCGGRWDPQLAPFLDTQSDTNPVQSATNATALGLPLQPAAYGGVIPWWGTPTGCTLYNDGASDRSKSAYHYMAAVKNGAPAMSFPAPIPAAPAVAADTLPCRGNFVLLITDGAANGPNDDSTCSSSACTVDAADNLSASCTCGSVLAAYRMRTGRGPGGVQDAPTASQAPEDHLFVGGLGVRTYVVGFGGDVGSGNGVGAAINDNIAKAGGTDKKAQRDSLGNQLFDGSNRPILGAPYAYNAVNEAELTVAIQTAIFDAARGNYSTAPASASAATVTGAGPQAGTLALDARVLFPSWRGELQAFDVAACEAGPTGCLKWRASDSFDYDHLAPTNANYGMSTDGHFWWERRIFAVDGSGMFRIRIDPSTHVVNATDLNRLLAMGLGNDTTETDRVVRWMFGDPTMGNNAVLGAMTNSTPIDIGPPSPVRDPTDPNHVLASSKLFADAYAQRPHLIYVGADDGMLHAFFSKDTTVGGTLYKAGSEAFAFIPRDMIGTIMDLYLLGGQPANPSEHVFGVANSPKAKDVCIAANCSPASANDNTLTANDYRTFLIVPEGYGGPNTTVLDVTNPFSDTPPLANDAVAAGWAPVGDNHLALKWDTSAFDHSELGETISLAAFYVESDPNNYDMIFASGYPPIGQTGTPGRGIYIVDAKTGNTKYSSPHDFSATGCSKSPGPEFSLLADVATARDFSIAWPNGAKFPLLAAFTGDTWGNIYMYDPNNSSNGGYSTLLALSCEHPIHFAPAVAQVDANGGAATPCNKKAYVIAVTNSTLDDVTAAYQDSKIVITKVDGSGGTMVKDTTFGSSGTWSQSIPASTFCSLPEVTDATYCATQHPRPLGTPSIILNSATNPAGPGFKMLSFWYIPSNRGCGKGQTFAMVHDFAAGGSCTATTGPTVTTAAWVGNEPITSAVFTNKKAYVVTGNGPVNLGTSIGAGLTNLGYPVNPGASGGKFQTMGWIETDR